MEDSPGLLLVERVDACLKLLREAGLQVGRIDVEWLQPPVSLRDELSERERAVLTCLVKGYTYEAIANELGISQKTVGSYIQRVREKTKARSRKELIEAAARHGITT
jgi:DNA-binding NarL/FixJ family response regulator